MNRPTEGHYNSRLVFDWPKLLIKNLLRVIFFPVYILFGFGTLLFYITGLLIGSIESILDKKWEWY